MVWRRRGGRASFCRAAKEADGKRRSPRLEGDSRRDCLAEPRGAANGGRPFEGERGLCLRCGPVARHPEEALERAGAAAMRALRVPAAREGVHNPATAPRREVRGREPGVFPTVPRDRAGRCEGVNRGVFPTVPRDRAGRCEGVNQAFSRPVPRDRAGRYAGTDRHGGYSCLRRRFAASGKSGAGQGPREEAWGRTTPLPARTLGARFGFCRHHTGRAAAREKVNF